MIGPTPQIKLNTFGNLTLEQLGMMNQDIYIEEHTLLSLLLEVHMPFCDSQTNTTNCRYYTSILEKGTGRESSQGSDFVAKLPDAELLILSI